ncbi:MAG: hypothetical protein KDJ52_14065 [Anaerolineae bacterium]|nr:hypothetical protein [Anaerolineae bacterium]
MFIQLSKNVAFAMRSTGASAGERQLERATIYSGDIRRPWRSVYGFSMTAARLAMGEEMVLSCREDEIFDYLTQLNALLKSPECLNRACNALASLAQNTQQKFERLIRLRDEPLSDSEIPDLITEVENILADSTEHTLAERLACILRPDNATQEIIGVGKMLARLRRGVGCLEQMKVCGFQVMILDQQRQLKRPSSNITKPIASQAEPAGPAQYHQTLWNYRIARYAVDQPAR